MSNKTLPWSEGPSVEETTLASQASMIAEFHKAYNLDPSEELSMKLIEEELAEVKEAGANLLKELVDLMYVVGGAGFHKHTIPQALAEDMMGVAYLANAFFPAIVDEAFRRVHESNMSKLGVDGKPIYRSDGKVLKGANYKLADLSDLI